MEIYNYQDKRILKLAKVEQRPYYYSGIKMRELLLEACNNYDGLLDKGEAFNDALAKIASFGYNVSIKRFKIIINSMFWYLNFYYNFIFYNSIFLISVA